MSEDKQSDFIQLDQFLKWKNIVGSGGEAKHVIRDGLILVNGEVEVRRGRKLRTGDRVEANNEIFVVEIEQKDSDSN